MAWNGSGVFARIHNWVSDRDNSIKITAPRHDEEDNNLANGIQACLTKNGENSPTANLPMATYNHTNVGNATARNHYAAAGQIQDGALVYDADTGVADAYVMTLTPAITAYAEGAEYRFKALNANTGASTLNINGVGATAIRKNGTDVLIAGDIKAGAVYSVVYDGTVFQMMGEVIASTLGTASTKDVTTSVRDTTSGRVLRTGDAGILIGPAEQTTDADTLTAPGTYFLNSGSTNIPFSGTASGILEVISVTSSSTNDRIAQQFTVYTGASRDRVSRRTYDGSTWSSWAEVTASENRAVGGTGTYALMWNASSFAFAPGDTTAGSGLEYCAASGTRSGTVASGTWRCMGYAQGSSAASTTADRVTTWMRVS